ncbi:alpha/beta hydrolase family protein [Nocardioides fonticola]
MGLRTRWRRRALGVVGAGSLAMLLTLALAPMGAAADRVAPAEEGPVTLVSTASDRPLSAAVDYARLMALPSIDSGARPRSSAPLATGADDCPPPRCSDRRVPVPPGVQITSNLVRVLLPVGYRAPRNRDRRYPVIFLWNGVRNDHDAWTLKTEILRDSRAWPAIFVMPAGGKLEQAGMFSDWADGTWDWETYHTQVLVPWVDEHYRTIPGARASAGASMGGIGALNYAIRHPGLFRAVLSVSGLPDTTLLAQESVLGTPAERPDLRRVWGDPVLDRANWDAHNPTLHVDALRDVSLFVTCGTGYTGDPNSDAVFTGDFEKSLWETHRGFLAQLTAHDVPYRARIAVGGAHNWPYFDPMMRWAIPQIIDLLAG